MSQQKNAKMLIRPNGGSGLHETPSCLSEERENAESLYRLRASSYQSESSDSSDRDHFLLGRMSPISRSPELCSNAWSSGPKSIKQDCPESRREPRPQEESRWSLHNVQKDSDQHLSNEASAQNVHDYHAMCEIENEMDEIPLVEEYQSSQLPEEELTISMGLTQLSDKAAALASGASDYSKEASQTEDHHKARPNVASFQTLAILGQGSFGKVYLVKKKSSGLLYAMKVLRKASIVIRGPKTVEHTRSERAVLEQIRHPFIVKLYWAFQTANKLCLVLEYVAAGELFSYLASERIFTERTTAFFMGQLVLALEHLHSFGILYRDLKPENILLAEDGYARLCDFGLCKTAIDDDGSRAQTACGTTEYLAPEVIMHANLSEAGKPSDEAQNNLKCNSGYSFEADWYSLGAVMHDCLTGSPPFVANNRRQTIEAILTKKLNMHKFPHLSSEAKGIVSSLLRRDARVRLGSSKDPTGEDTQGSNVQRNFEQMRGGLCARPANSQNLSKKRSTRSNRSGSTTPTPRSGSPIVYRGAEAVKRHAFFVRHLSSFDDLLQKRLEPPLLPMLSYSKGDQEHHNKAGEVPLAGQSPEDVYSTAHYRASSDTFGGFSYVAEFAHDTSTESEQGSFGRERAMTLVGHI